MSDRRRGDEQGRTRRRGSVVAVYRRRGEAVFYRTQVRQRARVCDSCVGGQRSSVKVFHIEVRVRVAVLLLVVVLWLGACEMSNSNRTRRFET